eukprot:TRINITY_DN3687_c0_g2_i2.p1 TRINITY_DN3687_c0_g2~~TRINITY_DN3687_c0_g2_i2.p1  ORF type:complete len:577 (-),score=113.06 TRINITY_DN3687_c0_g2_i2:285-2015(-)
MGYRVSSQQQQQQQQQQQRKVMEGQPACLVATTPAEENRAGYPEGAGSQSCDLLKRRDRQLLRVSTDTSTSAVGSTISLESPQPSLESWDSPDRWLRAESLERNLIDGMTVAPDGREIVFGPLPRKINGVQDQELREIATVDSGCGAHMQAAIDMISQDIFGLPFSVSVAIPTIEDTPLVGISDGFCQLTGWSREEIIGRNCRFMLKGVREEDIQSDVRVEAKRFCKAAYLRGLSSLSHTLLLQRNARKCGECFWNLFMLSLVPGPNKQVFVVGLQLDLGPTLGIGTDENSMKCMLSQHQERLVVVRNLMFGKRTPRPLAPPDDGEDGGDAAALNVQSITELVLAADDVKEWLRKADAASEAFQQWGTLPWVAWPSPRAGYALMNGGVSILRLEADRKAHGALAMSVFPVQKKSREARFKVQVDGVISPGCAAWLPGGGFTEVAPTAMDELGGLPKALEFTACSVTLRGDGRCFRCTRPSHFSPSAEAALAASVPGGEGLHEVPRPAVPRFERAAAQADTLEYVWGNGYMALEINGFEVLRATDGDGQSIIGSPPKSPLYAVFDCCHTVCKATLMQ